DVGQDLQSVADQLQNSSIIEYLTSEVLSAIPGSFIDPYKCGLPIDTQVAQLVEFTNPRNLKLEINGSLDGDQVLGQFELEADATIEIFSSSSSNELGSSSGSADNPSESSRISKSLLFRGIITLDGRGRPLAAELSTIEAPQ